MPLKKYRLPIEIFWFWLFPLLSLTIAYQQLLPQYGADYSWFLLLFPALTMYFVVSTGAGYCKFWYFTTRYSPEGVMLTIGLVYAAVISVGTVLAGDWLLAQPILFVLTVGLVTALLGTFIDVFLLGSGLFYLKSKRFPLGSNPVRHALSYGPAFFGIVGLWNALGLLLGYRLIVAESTGWSTPFLTIGLAIGFALPFIVFFLRRRWVIERKKALRPAAE